MVDSLETSGAKTAVFVVLVLILAGAFAVKLTNVFTGLAATLPQ